MSFSRRRLSLDSSVLLDVSGGLGPRRGSSCSRFSKKYRPNLDVERADVQESNPFTSLREQPISEENVERADGLINRNSFVKHNKTFHKLFPGIPDGENLTHTFTCALQKEVLYQGKLFVSDSHVCFYSSVLLKDTKVVIPVCCVLQVKKHKSALSMLSIHTADGEKYSFVSLRNREMCHKLLQGVCSHVQVGSTTSSPHISCGETEVSSYSSLEDCLETSVSRHNSIALDNVVSSISNDGPRGCSTRRQSSVTDGADSRATSLIGSVMERVSPPGFLRGRMNLNSLVYIYVMLMLLLLLGSGYIGLRIIALEEQLGALTELSLHHREYQQT